jgi:hypothetical protein
MEIKAGTLKTAQNFIPIKVHRLEDIDKDTLNLINLKELESLLKKGAETILFLVKEGYDIDIDLTAIFEAGPADALQISALDLEMQ